MKGNYLYCRHLDGRLQYYSLFLLAVSLHNLVIYFLRWCLCFIGGWLYLQLWEDPVKYLKIKNRNQLRRQALLFLTKNIPSLTRNLFSVSIHPLHTQWQRLSLHQITLANLTFHNLVRMYRISQQIHCMSTVTVIVLTMLCGQ